MSALSDRIVARLRREAAKATVAVSRARRHPRSQKMRRDLERLRVAARLQRAESPDMLLDAIVADANEAEASAAADARNRVTHDDRTSQPAVVSTTPARTFRPPSEPLRVGVVAPRAVPATDGGAERHWASLVRGLADAGLDAELVLVDCLENDLTEVLESYRRFLRLDVSSFDVVISGKYPSWMIRHHHHIRHLNHPLRGLYERYPAHLPAADAAQREEVRHVLSEHGAAGLIEWALERADCQPFPGPFAQAVVQALDLDAASRIARHAVVSEHVAERPHYLPDGVDVAVIPPLTDLATAESVQPDPDIRRHFLAHGRHTAIKRLDLTIAGFAACKRRDLELRIAGHGPETQSLQQLAATVPGVEMLGYCADAELAAHITGSIAVVAIPEDEDFGLIAAEAHAAGRPVITAEDSGGVAEQIEHERNGLVVRPSARAIGRAITRLADDPVLADRLGRAGADDVAARTWQPLTRLVRDVAEGNTDRKQLLILSTFPAEPVLGGGARRLRGMASALQIDFDVVVLSLTNRIGPTKTRRRILSDGVRQVLVGRSRAHLAADAALAALVGLPADDIGCSVLHPATSAWNQVLEAELATADAIMLAHPFLAPSLPNGVRLPVVYDAHNVETDLKRTLLEGRRGEGRLCQWATAAERAAFERASIVTATSSVDASRLRQLYEGPVPLVAANGVEDVLLRAASDDERRAARHGLLADLGLSESDQRPIVSFVASDHPPNHAAADAIAEATRGRNDLIVLLAGAHSGSPREGVFNYGRFRDATHRRLLLGSSVALNPVEAGSGTNLKLIEALAVGTPVVATPTGARGLDSPESVLMVSTLPELAAAIDAVLVDPRTDDRVRAGQLLAREHEWKLTTAALKAALAEELGVTLAG